MTPLKRCSIICFTSAAHRTGAGTPTRVGTSSGSMASYLGNRMALGNKVRAPSSHARAEHACAS
eukprot:5245783-Alexandrium_andersonii.AAC.1